MKKKMFILMFLFLGVLLVGCNKTSTTDNELTEPLTSEQVSTTSNVTTNDYIVEEPGYEIGLSGSVQTNDSYEVDSNASLILNADGSADIGGNYAGNLLNSLAYSSFLTIDPLFDGDNSPIFSWPTSAVNCQVMLWMGNDLYLVRDPELGNGMWGIMDSESNILVDPNQYTYIDFFYEGIARVSSDEGVSSQIMDGSLKIFYVAENSLFGYVKYLNDGGVVSIEDMYPTNNERFSITGIFQGDYAIVGTGFGEDLKFGVIDKNGDYVVEPIYDYINREIVDNKIIVASGVTYEYLGVPVEMTYPWTDLPYYSESVGVYDLETGAFMVDNTHDIVTCLEPNVYFVWDADTLTEMVDTGEANAALLTERDPDLSYGRIIDLENQTEVWLTEPYFNMVKYNDEYNIGLYEDKLYLVNMTTGETLAAYDRYFELLKYFNIEPCIDDPNISETVDLTLINHYEIFIYNFSTYINSIDREVDFIFEDLSFIVWDLDYRKDNQMISTNGALIDKFGNVILEYPEGYLPYCIPISGMESYNPNIIYANSLIPMQPLGGGNDKAYMNLEGEIVANGLSQANPFYNGAALCAKEVAVSGGMAELYYTIDNTGNMTQIDIGMDYFSTITTDEGTIVRNGYVVMISRGVYHMLVRFENQEDGSGSGYDYIINTYGDVLATHISINSMNFFALNELYQLPDHYQIYFEDTQVKSDVIQILSGTGVNSLLVLLRNPYTGDHETETVVYDERFMTGEQRITHPFIFNFSESNQISVYLNDVLVDSSNYTWYEDAMHLYFDDTYIANQESNILNFHIISGTETADVTVYKENVPASMYEYIESMYQEVVVSYVDTTIIDVEIFNILDTGLIDTAYLCGEDISSTITSVTAMSEFNSVMVFINYQGVFTLEPGIYELYIGNATRMIHVYVHVE